MKNNEARGTKYRGHLSLCVHLKKKHHQATVTSDALGSRLRRSHTQAANAAPQNRNSGIRLANPRKPMSIPKFLSMRPAWKAGQSNSCTGDFTSVGGITTVETPSNVIKAL